MSKNATVSISVNISGDSVATNVGPLPEIIVNTPYQHMQVSILAGNVQVDIPQIPSAAKYMLIIPPTSSSVNKWLMTTGDTTGYMIDNALPFIASIGSISFFVIRSSGSETLDVYFF